MAQRRVRLLVDLVGTLILAAVLALVARTYLVSSYLVLGDSMNPNLHDGERVFITRVTLRQGVPERGDIVVFRYPLDPSREFVKRVIGLPGDEVEVRQGRLYVNGSFVVEGYRIVKDRSSMPDTRVPEGDLFVLGDNRPVSEDSRYFGFVPLENVRGEVFLVYWPPTRIEWIGALAGGS